MNQCIPRSVILRVLETTHLSLIKPIIETNFLLRSKCWARGRVARQLPMILEWSPKKNRLEAYGPVRNLTAIKLAHKTNAYRLKNFHVSSASIFLRIHVIEFQFSSIAHPEQVPGLPSFFRVGRNSVFWPLKIRELKQGRFWATRVNQKWPFCIIGQKFFPNFLAVRLSKSKDT